MIFFLEVLLPTQTYDPEDVIHFQRQSFWGPDCSAFVKGNVAEESASGANPTDSANPLAFEAFEDNMDDSNVDHALQEAAQKATTKMVAKRSKGQPMGLSRKKRRH